MQKNVAVTWRALHYCLLATLFIEGWGGLTAQAHDWYPYNCCSGHDCRPIKDTDIEATPAGFLVKENGEVIPYDSPKVKRTPPEGGGLFHRCSQGGTAQGATICLYIPNFGG